MVIVVQQREIADLESRNSTSGTCSQATKAEDLASSAANSASGSEKDQKITIGATIIVQNPSCFTPELRAHAQNWLTRQQQGSVRDAICNASGQPWWKCEFPR
ncbi:hypothetical protein OOK31_25445 [Streptomyces sp. NBC_00249]|uniref:hypothetical protein n=1 Tax=Streptomyces sp. NBC_00249 TaxID=2975690 RepID=UPI002254A936|nr:hypothetical protein [Streptomyces sp. NBC_00249]MCX5197202.1 hypothetical protein [Streptomyces sp. NBC_00249]